LPENGQSEQQRKAGWRKYTIALLGLLLGFSLALFGKLTGEFATIVTVVVGSYQAANAAVAFAKKNGNS